MENIEALLTADDVAQILKCKVQAVRELSRQRTQHAATHPLPSIRIHKKCVRYRHSDIEQWLNQIAGRKK